MTITTKSEAIESGYLVIGNYCGFGDRDLIVCKPEHEDDCRNVYEKLEYPEECMESDYNALVAAGAIWVDEWE